MDSYAEAISFYEKKTPYKVRFIQPKESTGNHVFSINWNAIVRIKEKNPTDDPFYQPSKEKFLLNALLKQRPIIVPPLMEFDQRRGHKIEAQIPLRRIQGFRIEGKIDYARVYEAIEALKKLHTVRLDPSFHPFCFRSRMESYFSRSFSPLNKEIELRLMDIAEAIDAKYPCTIAHRDLHEGNLLFAEGAKESLYISDFELAGSGSSLSDLASLIEENDLDECEEQILIDTYGDASEKRLLDLHLYKLAYDALWYEWAKCRYLDTGNPIFQSIAEAKARRFNASLPSLSSFLQSK